MLNWTFMALSVYLLIFCSFHDNLGVIEAQTLLALNEEREHVAHGAYL